MKKTVKEGRTRYCHMHNPDVKIPRPLDAANVAIEKKKIAELLGQGLRAYEIAEKIGIHPSTVYERLKEMADFIRAAEGSKNEAVMQIVQVKQEVLRMAYSDFALMRRKAMSDNGQIDPKHYETLEKQIRTIGMASESLENTMARLNLLPPEPRRLDVSGQLDSHQEVVQIIIEKTEPLLALAEGEKNGRAEQ